MKHLLFTISILSLLLLSSCQPKAAQKSNNKQEANDSTIVQKTYHPGGGLWKVNRIKKVEVDGKSKHVLHGEVLEYYKTPQNALSSRAIYKNGKREGLFIKYYTNGEVYYNINYKGGKMNGIKKSFHKNGQLMAEMPYENSYLGVGTKEYTPDGKLLAPMELKVWSKKSGDTITIYAKTLNKGKLTKRVKYFRGVLINGKYTHTSLQNINMKDGIAQISLQNSPKSITISAKVTSAHNNYILLSKTIKLN